MFEYKNNEMVPMTRRYPNLKRKVLERDAKIAAKLARAWDVEHDERKVLQIFVDHNAQLSHQRYWELLRTVWIICGSVKLIGQFRIFMCSSRPHKYYFSTPEEAAQFRDMKEGIDLFRATDDANDGGISWTTSREYAESYKEQFSKRHILIRPLIKTEVFAYINRNREDEIIIL